MSGKTISKETFCSGYEVPLNFRNLLCRARKALKEQGLRPMYFSGILVVPSRLSDETISEISLHIVQIAKKFAGQSRCSYLGGGEISTKSATLEDDGRELCKIAVEMTGG